MVDWVKKGLTNASIHRWTNNIGPMPRSMLMAYAPPFPASKKLIISARCGYTFANSSKQMLDNQRLWFLWYITATCAISPGYMKNRPGTKCTIQHASSNQILLQNPSIRKQHWGSRARASVVVSEQGEESRCRSQQYHWSEGSNRSCCYAQTLPQVHL